MFVDLFLLAAVLTVEVFSSVVNSDHEVARCGLRLGLSLDIGQFVVDLEGGSSSLRVVVRKGGHNPGCRLLLDSARCPASQCREELCRGLVSGETRVTSFVLVETGGKGWKVGCETFSREEMGDKSVSSRMSGDEGGRRSNEEEEGGLGEELLPAASLEAGSRECDELFNRNQTKFGSSPCCEKRGQDPRCLLGAVMHLAKKKGKFSSQVTEHPTTDPTSSSDPGEEDGVGKVKVVSSNFRGSYYTLLAFFLIFLVIFLVIIGFLMYKLRAAKAVTDNREHEMTSGPQEISHRRFSECLPLTPSSQQSRQQTSAFLFPQSDGRSRAGNSSSSR